MADDWGADDFVRYLYKAMFSYQDPAAVVSGQGLSRSNVAA